MWYFIYVCESMYGGLHGIYDYYLCKCYDEDEAISIGRKMARELVDSYLRPEEEYYTREDYVEEMMEDEWSDDFEDDYWERLDKVIEDNLCVDIYPLREGVTYEDYEAWQKKNVEPNDFIDNYCIY